MSRKLIAMVELALAVTITVIATPVSSLRCYKCTTTRQYYSNDTVRLCSEFDYSAKYVVECPYSTFCAKRYFTTRYPNSNEIVNATERDCASQKRTTQNYVDGRWRQEFVIEEPYQAGCQLVDTKGAKTTSTLDCYCKSELCNVAATTNTQHTSVIIALSLLFTTILYNL